MLKLRMNEILTRKIDRFQLRQVLFEFELSLGLPNVTEFKTKILEFSCESDSVFESRLLLFGHYLNISNTTPERFDKTSLQFIEELRNQVSSNLLFEEKRNVFNRTIFHLETEMRILSCLNFFHYDQDGLELDETGPDLSVSIGRFLNAVHTLKPLFCHVTCPQEEEELICRNLRLDRVIRICDGDKFFMDDFQQLDAEFNEIEKIVSLCSMRIVCELQKAVFPNENLLEKMISIVSTTKAPKEKKKRKKHVCKEEEEEEKYEFESAVIPPPPPPLRVKFTSKEDDALRRGLEKYGRGNWKSILNDHELNPVFNSVKPRSAVDLKDRARNLTLV